MRYRPTLTVLMLMIAVILALPARAQQKPFTEEQVSNLVRSGLENEADAKLIEQRGIDFAPAEEFLESLKAAGANEAFLCIDPCKPLIFHGNRVARQAALKHLFLDRVS